MFNPNTLITWMQILVIPVQLSAVLPLGQTDTNAQSQNAPYQITLDTAKVEAITVNAQPKPNFDTDVLAPLRAAQAGAAAKAAAKKASRKAATTVKPLVIGGDDALAQLRYCEAGGDYTRNSGNGYYGAYQYSISTWNNFGGFARADLAPPNVQDEKVRLDVARRGWTPWPSCASRLGLL